MRKAQLFLFLLLLPAAAFAYEPEVHRLITRSAIALASQQNDFLKQLGTSSVATFGGSSTAEMLAGEGAVHEDDSANSLNHFFDPADGIALQAPPYICASIGWVRADTWANDGLLNDYSFADAKSWMRTAISGPTPTQRDLGYRMLFTTLGHAVHLVQDMAQPEHTRNDQHLTGSALPNGKCTPGSLYEYWTLHHLSGLYPETLPNADAFFAGFQVVKLPSYFDYFSTGDRKGLADLTNRNFVTQDTNYGDEAGWAIPSGRCVTLHEPTLDAATGRVEVITETILNSEFFSGPQEVSVPEIVFSYPVNDAYKGLQVTDQYHTHLSSIEHELQMSTHSDPLNGGDGVFSLSNHSYASRAAILVPRAVEYSAGLIDHFFRGRVAAAWTKAQNDTWTLTITNQSAEKIGPEMKVLAVYKATPQYFNRINTEDTQVLFDDVVAAVLPDFDGLDPGEAVTIPGIFAPGLHPGDSILQFERRIAVIGSLGTEPQVVIPVVQPASGLRMLVDASPAVVTAKLHCAGVDTPLVIGVEKPFGVSGRDECRAIIVQPERPGIGHEGVATSIRLRVWRDAALVEDLSAVIDAGDLALGGCHRATNDGHCDRFIQRTGNCVFDAGYLDHTKCTTTSQPWDWGTGPY
jgi:hypothetical protein